MQVSFGIHESEEEAAQQYDRALIVEKGRAAKTNYPISTYDEEVVAFEAFTASKCASAPCWIHTRCTSPLPCLGRFCQWYKGGSVTDMYMARAGVGACPMQRRRCSWRA